MASLIGKSATAAHMALLDLGFHEESASLNPSVIFIIYARNGEFVTLLVDKVTHEVADVA